MIAEEEEYDFDAEMLALAALRKEQTQELMDEGPVLPYLNGLTPVGLRDWLARDLPKPKWVINRWLAEGDLTMIAGDAGVGKSWLLDELALRMASGTPMFGQPTRDPMGVVLFQEEMPAYVDMDRFRRLRMSMDLDEGYESRIFPYYQLGLDLSTPASLDKVTNILTWLKLKGTPAGMLILDSLAATKGAYDENSNDAMNKFMYVLKGIAQEYSLMVVMNHHTRKPDQRLGFDPAYALRGATAIKAALDNLWVLNAEGAGWVRLHAEKLRNAERPSDVLRFKVTDMEGGAVTLAYQIGEQETAHDRANKTLEIREFVVEALKRKGTERQAVIRSRLVESGLVASDRLAQKALKELAATAPWVVEGPSNGRTMRLLEVGAS